MNISILVIHSVHLDNHQLYKTTLRVLLQHLIQLKLITKAQISGKLVSSDISDAAFASVTSEKTCLKKLMITIIMNLSQETTVFGRHQKMTSAMKLRPEK